MALMPFAGTVITSYSIHYTKLYDVDTLLHVGKTRSLFAVFYACDPENVSKVRGIVEKDLRAIREMPVTAAELLRNNFV